MKLDSKVNQLAAQGGFTLIEMLIVVAIIAILVAIAVPALNTAKADAQNSKADAIEAAVGLAKTRAILKDVATPGDAALFADFDDYLLINGVQPTNVALVADKANNGTGLNITGWGNYPLTNGTGGSGVAWDPSAAAATE